MRAGEGGQQRMRWLDGTINSMDMSLSKLWEMVKDRKSGVLQSMGSQRVRNDLVTDQQGFSPETLLAYLTMMLVFLVLSPNHMVDGLMLIVWSGILFLEVMPHGNLFH